MEGSEQNRVKNLWYSILMSETINKGGRPTIYSVELTTNICKRIAEGESLRDICKDEDMPNRSTIHEWLLDESKKEFSDQYELACNIRAESMFDELTEIADDGTNDYMEKQNKDGSTYTAVDSEHIQRSRLRVDTRKWYLSKVLPKKFGDKVDFTTKGDKIVVMPVELINKHDSAQSTS